MIPLLLNTATTGMLIGLIFTIQLVHYPLFAAVGEAAWPAYAAAHARRIGVLVVPWMALEAASALWLVAAPPPGAPAGLLWLALGLLALIWLLTALVNGPRFSRLAATWTAEGHRGLVLANWPRTVLWTARGT
ncbi:MAG TPA: hypothetical protein VFY20_01340, partial [Gemmatimonadales bacterium]|nr:hypothetical protein [Gemmatimonadales bacterium]